MKKSMLLLAVLIVALLVFSLIDRRAPTSAAEDVDITTLIKTADTPEDHLKIAEYYEEQAAMMDKKATLHESMAQAYEERGKMAGMATHCEKLAKDSEESAEQYEAMAAEHRKMAHEMQGQNSPKPQ